MHGTGEPMQFSIRSVRETDAASIVDVLNPIIEAEIHTTMDTPLTVDDQVAFIRGFPRRGVFHVAVWEETGRVVGLQDVVPVQAGAGDPTHEGEISTFVALGSQRLGIGRSLSEATFQAARALGFIRLLATIRADNERAVAFYLGQGFRVIATARRHTLVRGAPVPQVLAEKTLD